MLDPWSVDEELSKELASREPKFPKIQRKLKKNQVREVSETTKREVYERD